MEINDRTPPIHSDAVGALRSMRLRRALLVLLSVIGVAVWWFLYRSLEPFAKWVAFSVFLIPAGGHFGSAVEFFIYETPKVLMLLTVVVFGVGIVRSFFTPERTRRILAGRRQTAGNVLASPNAGA